MFRKYHRVFTVYTLVLSLSLSTLFISKAVGAQQWTLNSSIQQAISTSPELQNSVAEIGARHDDVSLSRLWPEPEIGFRIDNKLGQDDGAGGYDLTDITISQPIPLFRVKYQALASEANLKAAQFTQHSKVLEIQNRVSKVFHQLQFASAKLAFAKKQLALANDLNRKAKKSKSGVVVRYLTPLELMRLQIIREEARQAESNAEGKYHEALIEYAKLLVIRAETVASVDELLPITTMPDLGMLTEMQNDHAQLSSQQQQVIASKHKINVARNSQLLDPTVGFSWSRDSFDYGRDDVYAIMLNLQIPLSDRKNIAASKATYKASQQQVDLELLERELKINLNRSYTHLNHLVEQAADYKKKVLIPSKKMRVLTNKGFTSGELNVLSVVDANNTYFDARINHLDLLYQARVELAEVNFYAGQLLVDVNSQQSNTTEAGE